MSAKANKPWKLGWIVFALAVLVGLFAPESAAAGHRVAAQLTEPFEVNGHLFDHGELAVREIASYNPTMTLNEVWVGDRCLGLLLAAESDNVSSGTDDTLIFERTAQGHLLLVGFAYRGQGTNELYQFRAHSDGGRWLAPNESEAVLLAAQ